MTTLLKVNEVADMLKVSPSLVYAWASSGRLKVVYLPHARESKATTKNKSAIRIKLEEVENLIHSCSGMDAGR